MIHTRISVIAERAEHPIYRAWMHTRIMYGFADSDVCEFEPDPWYQIWRFWENAGDGQRSAQGARQNAESHYR